MFATRRSLAALAFALLLAGLLAAGCGGGDETAATTATETETETSTVPAGGGETTPEPIEPVGEGSTEERSTDDFPAGGSDVALLADVRVSPHGGDPAFDRVVLAFEGAAEPSWRVGYVEPPVRADGSGNVVDVRGEAFLEIRLAPASGVDFSGEEPRRVYTGPRRIEVDGGHVATEVVRVGDFEAQLAWVVGLEHRAPFAVALLRDPVRLVVDILDEEVEEQALARECSFAAAGWEIVVPYPADWDANEETTTDTGTVPACRIFDPDDPTPPRATELNEFGVLVHVDAVAFEDARGSDPLGAEVLEEDELTVAGRDAVRREDRLTEDGIRGPEGARVTTYVVDLDGSILVARTHELADLDYERNRDVLDAMMRELSVSR